MIKELKDLDFGIYSDAKADGTQHGLAYLNLSSHLAGMAQAGDISEDLVRVGPEAPRDAQGQAVAPVRQLLAHSGVRLSGVNASSVGAFIPGSADYVKGAEVLFPAFTQEAFEAAMGIRADEGFTSRPGSRTDDVYRQDTAPGLVDYRLENPARMVALDDLVSTRTGIDGDTYRAAVLKRDARDPEFYRYSRVAERGTFPTFTIELADRAFRLFKYGAAVESSYEALRRMRINLLALTLEEIAFGENMRRIAEAINTFLEGDGNQNPALDTETGAALTIRILDEWLLDTTYDYLRDITLVIADREVVKEIRALRYPQGDAQLTPAQLAMYQAGDYVLPDGTPLRVAPKGSALDGSGKLIGIVGNLGLNEIVENSSAIAETERFIKNQTQTWVMSVNLGHEKMYLDSAHTLTKGA